MKLILKHIIALSLMTFFLMANMGFALIHHSCNGCKLDSREIQFVLLSHSHNEQEMCFANQCCIESQEECSCNDQHEDTCQVEVNRLTTPFVSAEKVVQKSKLDSLSARNTISLLTFNNPQFYLNTLFNSIPNSTPISGKELLIVHSVFRL